MSREYKKELISIEINKFSTTDHVYVVPSGRKLRLDNFSGGHEFSDRDVRCSLLWDDEIIAVGYGQSFQIRTIAEFTGNGAKEILIRLTNNDPNSLHMSAWWEGNLL